jgi:N-methylhydantoinase B
LVPAGDRLIVEMPGGGGYGNPLEREEGLLATDCRDGLVTREAARREYGMVIGPTDEVDPEATRRLRARLRAERSPQAEIPLGTAAR